MPLTSTLGGTTSKLAAVENELDVLVLAVISAKVAGPPPPTRKVTRTVVKPIAAALCGWCIGRVQASLAPLDMTEQANPKQPCGEQRRDITKPTLGRAALPAS